MALMRGDATVLRRYSLWWSSPPGSEPVKESRPPFDRLQSTSAEIGFSRDGQLLVWMYAVSVLTAATSPSAGEFYVVPADAGAPRKVLSRVPAANLQWFSWLPDSRHVVLALPDARLGNRHLWFADTTSEELRQITSTHTNESNPAVSPDGHRVAYASDEVDFDLVLISADGKTRRLMLATARNEFEPAWTPSGDQFAFVTDRSGSLEIWSRSRDGQFERPIVTNSDFGSADTQTLGSLAFSPDGRTLAYQRSANRGFEIWLSPATGGTPVRLTAETDVYEFQDSPTWSPDGVWIAFTTTETNDGRMRQALNKVRVGTNEQVFLAEGVGAGGVVKWSPDGKWIVFQSLQGLARVAAQGGPVEIISDETFIDLEWQSDSRRLFALADSESAGHFALVDIDAMTGVVRPINDDLGSIPVANEPIRGLSFAKRQGFLTSLASARSDIWLMEGLQQPAGWLSRLLRR
jgi:Tol biopolymer transport system component